MDVTCDQALRDQPRLHAGLGTLPLLARQRRGRRQRQQQVAGGQVVAGLVDLAHHLRQRNRERADPPRQCAHGALSAEQARYLGDAPAQRAAGLEPDPFDQAGFRRLRGRRCSARDNGQHHVGHELHAQQRVHVGHVLLRAVHIPATPHQQLRRPVATFACGAPARPGLAGPAHHHVVDDAHAQRLRRQGDACALAGRRLDRQQHGALVEGSGLVRPARCGRWRRLEGARGQRGTRDGRVERRQQQQIVQHDLAAHAVQALGVHLHEPATQLIDRDRVPAAGNDQVAAQLTVAHARRGVSAQRPRMGGPQQIERRLRGHHLGGRCQQERLLGVHRSEGGHAGIGLFDRLGMEAEVAQRHARIAHRGQHLGGHRWRGHGKRAEHARRKARQRSEAPGVHGPRLRPCDGAAPGDIPPFRPR